MGYVNNVLNALLGRRPSDTSVEGTGGTAAIGGYLVTHEKNSALVGDNKWITYDNVILNTSIVAAGVRFYHALMSGVGWSLKPGKGPQAQRYADRIQQMIETELHQPWSSTIATIAHHKWLGFSVVEWIAENMDDGFQGLTWFENRPQSTIQQWDVEPQTGRVRGWIQRDQVDGNDYPLHRDKCVYIADKSITNMPDGCGMIRHVVELQRQLQRLEQLEGWAFETDLRGIPMGRAPLGVLDTLVAKKLMTSEQKDAKLKGLTDFVTNHIRNPKMGIILDSMPYRDEGATKSPSVVKQWDLELAKGDSVGLAEVHAAIERKQREIARAIGFEHLMLGGDGKGSNAQHQDKTQSLHDSMASTLNVMSWQLDTDVIDVIVDRNGWDKKQKPHFRPNALSLRSVGEVVDALEGMARAGATIVPNDPVVNQVRGMLELIDQPEISPRVAGLLLGAKDPSQPGETKKKATGG